MTTQQLKQDLQKALNLSEEEIDSLTASLADCIGEYMKSLDEVAIPGFGTFSSVKYDERVDVDPHTGEMSLLPPS